jgi:ribonuclease HI
MNLVIYTDGGFKNKIMSGGIHAYTYEEKDTKPVRFSGWTITDTGYISKEKPIPSAKNIIPLTYYDMSLKFGQGSSYEAETLAILKGIEKVLDKETIDHIYVRSDSESNITVFENGKKGRFKPDENGERMRRFYNMLDEKKITILFKHVRAHNSEIGNEIVDTYATIGGELDKDLISVRTARGYWNKSKDRNPFINGRRIIYETNTKRIKGNYRIVNVEDSSFVGRVDPKGLGYSLYSGKEDEYIEMMMDMLDEMTFPVTELATVNLPHLYNGFNFRFLTLFGKKAFRIDSKEGRILINSSERQEIIH